MDTRRVFGFRAWRIVVTFVVYGVLMGMIVPSILPRHLAVVSVSAVFLGIAIVGGEERDVAPPREETLLVLPVGPMGMRICL